MAAASGAGAVTLSGAFNGTNNAARGLYEAAGFAPVRYFLHMHRTLDTEVVEIGPHREDQGGAAQEISSCGVTASIPWALPTGVLINRPACVFRPGAREASSRHACAHPLSATATM